MAERSEEHLEVRRLRVIVDHERDDRMRELTSYLLAHPWVDPNALMGGLVDHEPQQIARLRELLEADRATVARCLETLDVLAAAARVGHASHGRR